MPACETRSSEIWQNRTPSYLPIHASVDRTNHENPAMLELRPNCELCDRDLPPAAANARICSYECTYCADCVDNVLFDVCPSCGGNFAPRPIRPVSAWREESSLGLQHHPASEKRKHSKWTADEVRHLAQRLRSVAPQDR